MLLGPGELGEVKDQRLLSGGLGGEVEVLQRLVGGEGGVADPVARPGGVAGEDLGLEQDLEELLVGPAFLARSAAVCSSRSKTLGVLSFASR